LIRPAAAELLRRRLDEASRILVLGAGGWFGTTTLELLAAASDAPVLALTARPRAVRVQGRTRELGCWSVTEVERFAPTHVVNCAFLTRDLLASHGRDAYIATNVALSARFLHTLQLPSVRAAVTISSGAAVASGETLPELDRDPYGHLKRSEELLSLSLAAELGVAVCVARAWSVSGPFVTRPRAYAFSDLIAQAGEGRLALRSAHEVWRRYVGVDELVAVALARAHDGATGTLESGGPLVELGSLAHSIAHELRPGLTLERPLPDGQPADRYHSDGRSWEAACCRLAYTPATLADQIRATAALVARAGA
jgi:nucleoside-diphosphate-sugar epimerase